MNTLFSPEILQAGAVKGLRRGRVGLVGRGEVCVCVGGGGLRGKERK